jgi:uncharacterized membrane protein HdeD (DUF308 family)
MAGSISSSQATEPCARRRWFRALGAFLIALGAAGVGVAALPELTAGLVFGPLVLAGSLFQFATAIFAEKERERLGHLASAGLEAVFGFLIMTHPLRNVVSLIALVAIFLTAIGLIRLARALTARSRGRAWAVMAGIIALLLGASLWVGWPAVKWWFAGLCIASDFIAHGVSWYAIALAGRTTVQAPASGGAQTSEL